MLTLADIVNQTCPQIADRPKWRSALNRLLQYPEIREAVKGAAHPQYPETALPAFHSLYALREKGYEPKELARRVRESDRRPVTEHPVSEQPAIPAPSMDLTVLPEHALALIDRVTELVAARTADRLAAQLLPPPEDRLIRADAAADLLACGVGSVHQQLQRAGVEPVALRPRRWKRSQVLRYIDQL